MENLGRGETSINQNRRRLFPDPTRKVYLNFKLHINLPGNPGKNMTSGKKTPGSLKENSSQIISFIFSRMPSPPSFVQLVVWLLEVSRPNVGAKRLARTCPQGPRFHGFSTVFVLSLKVHGEGFRRVGG